MFSGRAEASALGAYVGNKGSEDSEWQSNCKGIQRNRAGDRWSLVELLLERNLETTMLATTGYKPVSPPCRPVPGLIPFSHSVSGVQVDFVGQAMKTLHA